MFPYQLRTLQRMLQREATPADVQSGFRIPFKGSDGQRLSLHPVTCEVRLDDPLIDSQQDARGGILSEEMGVGKTLECLSLLLSTRGFLPCADEDEMASAVTSELAIQWPHKEWHGLDPLPKDRLALEQIPYYSREMEQGAKRTRIDIQEEPDATSARVAMPTLKDMCAHVIRMSGQSFAPAQYNDQDTRFRVMAMEPLLKSATPFFHLWPPLRGNRTPRVQVARAPAKIFLSPATLVVVPGTLLAQWEAEIAKHTIEGSLRVLYLRHARSVIPPAVELANEFDLILLSHSRLGKEDKEGALEWIWPSIPRECRCPYLGSSRTIDCHCPPVRPYEPSRDMSPLLLCKFKRLCVDEGHVAAGDSDMVRMATKIRAECRWVISGTPTESLVGSNLFRGSSSAVRNKVVSSVEKKDLEKLRALLADFLRVPHLQDWHSHYEMPFKKAALYSSTRLWTLLGRVMVRNRPEDVERNSPLPPLHDRVVRLQFTQLERVTFNVLQSLILLNAVWSQREDDDYFFHYSNRKHLASIMENLSLSCFHFAGPNLSEQAREALEHARVQLSKENKWSSIDREQAQMANTRLEEALNDADWVHRRGDVVFRTAQLGSVLVRAWKRQDSTGDLQLSAEETMAMQRAMRIILDQQASGTLEEGDVGRTEELITMGERDRRAFFARQAKAEQGSKGPQGVKSADDGHAIVATSPSKRATSGKRRSRMDLLEYTRVEYGERRRLPVDSGLRAACLTATSSTKLAKLLEVLSDIPRNEKVVIFSNLDNVLYEVSTALDIAWLPHFIYASGTNQERRNETVSAFRSEQTFARILLMKTNIGGRGLDLSCANHAIFLEPILDKSLRVQALKRTWRTGQQRPVHSTTLVIEETFEEQVLRISETAKTHKLSEDPSMRAVVSNPTFVSSSTHDVDRALYPPLCLFPTIESHTIIPLPTPPVSPDKRLRSEEQSIPRHMLHTQPSAHPEAAREIKKRRVLFA